MNFPTTKIKATVVGLSMLAISFDAFSGTIKIDLKSTCAYTTTTDANGNMVISCNNVASTPAAPTPTPTPVTPPVATRAPASKAEWNKAFSSLNSIPNNTKVDPDGYYNYLKTIYLNKPDAYKLPPGGLL